MSERLPVVPPKSRRQIISESEAFLRLHAPEHLERPGKLNVIHLFEDVLANAPYNINRGMWDGIGRDRFTVCHEIYHAIAHMNHIRARLRHFSSTVLLRSAGEIPTYQNPEWQANVFGGALLMPPNMVRLAIAGTQGIVAVNRIVDVFNVSRTAATVCLQTLGK